MDKPNDSNVNLASNAPPQAQAPQSPRLTEHQQRALQEAKQARDYLVPAQFACVLDAGIGGDGAMIYINSYLRDAGDPADPVERILLQQLLMAHHRLAQLHVRSEQTTSLEAMRILNPAATRLLGELRQLALAIRQYRAPQLPKQFSVVHQQNVVAAGEQTVSYVDQSTGSQDKVSFSARTKPEAGNPSGGIKAPTEEQVSSPAQSEPEAGNAADSQQSLIEGRVSLSTRSELEAGHTTGGLGGRIGERLGQRQAQGPQKGGGGPKPAALVG